MDKLNVIPFGSDLNNVAPTFGLAYRVPHKLGVIRSAAATHFGEIFFFAVNATFCNRFFYVFR